jgi:WD40 repeat protein
VIDDATVTTEENSSPDHGPKDSGAAATRRPSRVKAWLRERIRGLTGPDVFISYSRLDASEYTLALASRLTAEGLSCFVDQWGTPPGKTLPPKLVATVRNSTMFVLVGSEGSARSKAVTLELDAFVGTGRSIIPVAFADRPRSDARHEPALEAEWFQHALWRGTIMGLALAFEGADAARKASPSERLIQRIVNAEGFTRRSIRLRRALMGVLASIAVISLAGAGAALWFGNKAADAIEDRDSATRDKETAEKAAAKAAVDVRAADESRRQAEKLRDKAALAASREQEKAAAAAAEAQRQQAIASRLEAANEVARKNLLGQKLVGYARSIYERRTTNLSVAAALTAEALSLSATADAYDFARTLLGELAIPKEHVRFGSTVNFASLSHDGRSVALFVQEGESGALVVIDVGSGRALARHSVSELHWNSPTMFSFSRKWLIFGDGQTVKLWSWQNKGARALDVATVQGDGRWAASIDKDDRHVAVSDGKGITIVAVPELKAIGTVPIKSLLNAFMFSPLDANLLAVGDETGTVHLWDHSRQATVRSFKANPDVTESNPRIHSITSLTFSQRAELLMVGTRGGGSFHWDVRGEPKELPTKRAASCVRSAIAPDGSRRACMDPSRVITVVDLARDTVIAEKNITGDRAGLPLHREDQVVLQFGGAHNDYLLIDGYRGTQVWDLKGDRTVSVPREPSRRATALFAGESLLSVSEGFVRVWALPGAEPDSLSRRFEHQVHTLKASRSGRMAAGITSRPIGPHPSGRPGQLEYLAELLLWDRQSGTQRVVPGNYVVFSPTEKHAIVQGDQGAVLSVTLPDLRTSFSSALPPWYSFRQATDGVEERCIRSLDDRFFPSGTENQSVPVVDLTIERQWTRRADALRRWTAGGDCTGFQGSAGQGGHSVTFNRSGTLMAFYVHDLLLIHDAVTGRQLHRTAFGYEMRPPLPSSDGAPRVPRRENASVSSMWFAPDESTVFVITSGGMVWRWKPGAGAPQAIERIVRGPYATVSSEASIAYHTREGIIVKGKDWGSTAVLPTRAPPMALSANGRFLVAGPGRSVGSEGIRDGIHRVELWDITQRKMVGWLGDRRPVEDVQFSSDSAFIATATEERPVTVWNTAAAEVFRVSQRAPRSDFVFAGNAIATRVGPHEYWFSPLSPEAIAKELCRRVVRPLTVEEWNYYGVDGVGQLTCIASRQASTAAAAPQTASR